MSQEISIEFKVEGVEDVNAAFEQVGVSAEQCGGNVSAGCEKAAGAAQGLADAVRVNAESTNEAFGSIGLQAEDMGKGIRHAGREISVLGASASAVGTLGEQFGFLSKEQADVIQKMGNMTALFGTVVRGLGYIAEASWGVELAENARGAAHGFADAMAGGITKMVSAITGALGAIASSSIGVAIAEHARAIGHTIANALAGPWGWAILAVAAAAAAGGLMLAGQIPTHSEGGLVNEPTLTWVAEKEPELIIPVSKLAHYAEGVPVPIFNKLVKNVDALNDHAAVQGANVDKLNGTVTSNVDELARINHRLDVDEILIRVAGFAEGGIVTRPTVALVGEKEPELIVSVSKFNKFAENITSELSKAELHLAEVSIFSNEKRSTLTSNIFESSEKSSNIGLYRKASPLEFLTDLLAGARETEKGNTVTNYNIEIKDPVFRNKSDMNALVDRLRRMGMA
jgi:hypothetical protein